MFRPQDVLLKKNFNAALLKAEAWTTLTGRVDKLESDLPTQIEAVKKLIPNKEAMEALNIKVEGLATKTEVEETYAKKTDVESTYVKKADAEGEEGFAKKTEVASTYATKSELAEKEESLTQAISSKQAAGNYVTDEDLETKVKKLNLADKCETPEAAQAKATGALNDAKLYTDKKITDLVGGASEAYDTLKEIEDLLKKGDDVHAAINKMLAKKTGKFASNIGDGSKKEFDITHGLNTTDITITLFDNGSKNMVFTDVQITDENNVKVIFDPEEDAPTQDQVRIVIVG